MIHEGAGNTDALSSIGVNNTDAFALSSTCKRVVVDDGANDKDAKRRKVAPPAPARK